MPSPQYIKTQQLQSRPSHTYLDYDLNPELSRSAGRKVVIRDQSPAAKGITNFKRRGERRKRARSDKMIEAAERVYGLWFV